jgi:adenosylmethionine-8-amino-7-oxononanoate aminotransferase
MELASAPRCIGYADSMGLFAAIELVRDQPTKTAFPWQVSNATKGNRIQHPSGHVVGEMKNRAIIVRNNQGFISFASPLTITRAEIDCAMSCLNIGEIQREQIGPGMLCDVPRWRAYAEIVGGRR